MISLKHILQQNCHQNIVKLISFNILYFPLTIGGDGIYHFITGERIVQLVCVNIYIHSMFVIFKKQ